MYNVWEFKVKWIYFWHKVYGYLDLLLINAMLWGALKTLWKQIIHKLRIKQQARFGAQKGFQTSLIFMVSFCNAPSFGLRTLSRSCCDPENPGGSAGQYAICGQSGWLEVLHFGLFCAPAVCWFLADLLPLGWSIGVPKNKRDILVNSEVQ